MIISRTIIASAIAFLMGLLQLFGVTFELSVANTDILVNSLVVVVSTIAAIYFRVTAKTNLQTGAPLVPSASKPVDEIKPIVIKD